MSGSFGERTKKFLDAIKAHPQGARFASMTNIDYNGVGSPGYGERVAAQLEQDIKNGAIGLKVWKNFGMREKDVNGKRVPVDDPRLDPVWDVCAKYKIPVMIHTADPSRCSTRWINTTSAGSSCDFVPNRAEAGQDFSWDQMIGEQHNLFAKHPKTIFIAAHMGWMAHDLQALGAMLDRMPNLNVEIAAILGELGRQPRNAKKFFVKYQDRILFGKDTYNVSEYPFYFRMLESDDEWIDNIRKYHGLWKLYAPRPAGRSVEEGLLQECFAAVPEPLVGGVSELSSGGAHLHISPHFFVLRVVVTGARGCRGRSSQQLRGAICRAKRAPGIVLGSSCDTTSVQDGC